MSTQVRRMVLSALTCLVVQMAAQPADAQSPAPQPTFRADR
jgi:hypothetical protein